MNKTKEEILAEHGVQTYDDYNPLFENVKKSMNQWADQQSSSLKEENQKLREALEELEREKDKLKGAIVAANIKLALGKFAEATVIIREAANH